MEIITTYVAYSHRPGFRRFGQIWSREPRTIGVVAELPEGGRRTHPDVDVLATQREVERLVELNREEAFPLRIAEGATDPTTRRIDEARGELDRLREAIDEARTDKERCEQAASEARREIEALRTERAELQEAVRAAEARARSLEQGAGLDAPGGNHRDAPGDHRHGHGKKGKRGR